MKYIRVNDSVSPTNFELWESSFWKGTIEKLDSFKVSFDVNSVHDTIQDNSRQKCIKIFQEYIKDRLTIGWMFHNRALTFSKINCAVQVIEACLEKNENIRKTNIRNLFQEASKLDGRKDEDKSPLPYGKLGICMIKVMNIIDPNQLILWKEHDKKLEDIINIITTESYCYESSITESYRYKDDSIGLIWNL